MKVCARCRQSKPKGELRSAKNRRDGLYNYCRTCQDEDCRRYYQQHREQRIAYEAERRKLPEVAARRHQRSKRDYWENRDKHLAHAKEWMRNNRKRRREYIRKWNATNRDKVREYQKRYKALRRNATTATLTSAAWKLICATFGDRCVYCGREGKLEQDHVVALSRGGAHSTENVVPACRHCNATKLYNAPPPFWWTT